jgi:pSer/pThr/pTyr-binding forkhead associated (FHA) protein
MGAEPLGYLLGAGVRPMALFPGNVVTLGRDPQNIVPVDDALASRRHASIECAAHAIQVKDLSSRNGTFVNGKRLPAVQPFSLRSGDQVRIGGKLFSFISTAPGLEPRKAALQSAQQLAVMQTLSDDIVYENGKIVPAEASPPATATVPSSDAPPPTASLSGNLSDTALPQIMQFLNASAMTGRLYVKGSQFEAAILFLEGALHAATSGSHKGVEAVYAAVLQHEGHFSFDRLETAVVASVPKNVGEGTIQVIFECCRRMDEDRRGGA